MSEIITRTAMYEELLRRMAAGVRAAQLYAPDHPLVSRNSTALINCLSLVLAQQP
jgi:hypothetical protein